MRLISKTSSMALGEKQAHIARACCWMAVLLNHTMLFMIQGEKAVIGIAYPTQGSSLLKKSQGIFRVRG
jgi:hypothetical protein